MTERRLNRKFPINVVLPAFITLFIFILVFFYVIVPYYEVSLMNRKKEMIRELTNSAWSILENYHNEANEGLFSQEHAKELAIDAVGNLRYGEEFKDYFWITNMVPEMIIHPYRPDLNGTNLSNYKDSHGKLLFIECIDTVKSSGEGFVDYMWQWKDDSMHIVPKLSYVKGFTPWDWVLGTGIYLEDMYQEIKALKKRLVVISVIILLIICIILAYIVYQNIRLENKRQEILKDLKHSREKYKMLVESSTEGVIMILDREIFYVNAPTCILLGYNEIEIRSLEYHKLFFDENLSFLDEFFNQDKEGKEQKLINIETKLLKKNKDSVGVQLSVSSIVFEKQTGCLITIKDISKSEQAKKDLDLQVEKFKLMTDQVDIGVFRSTLGKNGKFVDINDAALKILGFTGDEIAKVNILDIFSDKENKKEILKKLFDTGEVIDQLVRIKTKENSIVSSKVSLYITQNQDDNQQYCDGIIQDISQQIKQQEETKQLVEDLQLANMFLNQAVKTLEMPVLRCNLADTIEKVVQKMARTKSEVVLIETNEGVPVGTFSDSDLRERVIAEGLEFSERIHKAMVAPLITISENRMLFEAILKMRAKQVKYICMLNVAGEVTGVLSLEDLANAQHHSQTMLVHRIRAAETKEELKDCYQQLAPLVKALMESGMNVQKVTALISDISDEITLRTIHLCKEEIGEAPVKYAFITLGSVGRKEQTLATDQDNAFIIEDVSEDKFEKTQKYFLGLGALINEWLDFVGYTYCKGEVMVRNPKWCQPLSVWKKYFNKWISSSTPQAIIDTSIFYDLRFLEGEQELANELLAHTNEIEHNRAVFLYHLAQTILSLKPPISFFGNFIVDSGDEHKSSFDIKQVLTILTGFLRVYALKFKLNGVNSVERLHGLIDNGKFSEDDKKSITDTYNYLMSLRMKHQLELIEKGKHADNYINPRKVSEIERSILKKIFSKLSDLQSKLGFEFKGTL